MSAQHPIDQQVVDVVAAEVRVAVGREHLEDAVFDTEDGNVERAAAEVVDRDDARVALVETIRQRRCRRLVDDAKDLEPGDPARVARRRALRVVEVGRNGDHGAIDFVVELALLGEERLRAVLELAQHKGGNLRRRELLVADADAKDTTVAADPKWKMTRFILDVVASLAHEALHRIDRALRVDQQPPLRFASDVDGAFVAKRHDGRHEAIALLVANDLGRAVLDIGDEGVGGAEIDADDFAHITAEATQRTQRTQRQERSSLDNLCVLGVLCVEYASRVQLAFYTGEKIVNVVAF